LQVIHQLKNQTPQSPIVLLGFSLGGNVVLKFLGEQENKGSALIDQTIAVCPPIDLAYTTATLLKGSNRLYNKYYVNGLKRLGRRWITKGPIRSIIEFDNAVTAPQWGFQDAYDYYRQSSSCYFLSKIQQPCHLIFSCDDPFIDYRKALQTPL